MGKSKRIRSDRARQAVAAPERFTKNDAERKAKITTIVLISVIVALIVLTTALVVLHKSGAILRSTVTYRSDNFEVNGAMTTYMYHYAYNTYYNMGYGDYAYIFVTKDSITSSTKSMLALCEAAKAAGVSLDEDEIAEIEETVKKIKADAKAAGYSISQLYGNVGVNASDIRKVLELQTLSAKFRTQKVDELTGKYEGDAELLEKYFGENKTDLFSGGYLKVVTGKEEWQKALKEAKNEEEFKKIFIELYTNDNFKGKFNTASGLPCEKLLDAIISIATSDIKYKLLGETVEGVEIKETDDTITRLKAFYQKNPVKDTAGLVGVTTISSDMYKTIGAEVDALTKTLEESVKNETDKAAFIASEVEKKFKAKYDLSAMPSVSLLNSIGDAVEDLIAYFAYGYEIKDFEIDDSAKKITAEILQSYYEKAYQSSFKPTEGESGLNIPKADLYKTFASAADSLMTSVKGALVADTDHSYPTVGDYADDSEKEDSTTTKAEDDTTAADDTTTAGAAAAADEPEDTTTAAQTTTQAPSGSTTTIDKTVAVKPEELNTFDAWFFVEDRAVNDIFIDEKENIVYFVTAAPKDDTITKNVGHILIQFGSHTHEDGEEHSDDEYAEQLKKAEEILAEFLATDKTKDSFEKIGEKYTEDSNVFYDNVVKGEMVDEFENWIYDEARKPGDTEIVKTEYGYHVMYFVGDGLPAWQAKTLDAKVNKEVSDWETELQATYAVEVNESGLGKVFGS